MRKRTLLGIVLALIGIGITVYGFTVSSDLGENRYFRTAGYLLVFIGIFIAPDYKKSN